MKVLDWWPWKWKTHFNMVVFELNKLREECLNWYVIHVTLPLATNTILTYRIFLPSHFLCHFECLSYNQTGHHTRFCTLAFCRAVKSQASLRKCADLPGSSLSPYCNVVKVSIQHIRILATPAVTFIWTFAHTTTS